MDDSEMSGETKAPSRRESYSDHSESGEDEPVRAPAKMPNVTPMATFAREAPRGQEESICTMFYLPQKTPGTSSESESRYCQYYSVQSGRWCSKVPTTQIALRKQHLVDWRHG